MFCPYTFIKVEQINQCAYEYEDGMQKFYEHKMVEERKYATCDPDNCGAYDKKEGRCRYNAG